MAEDNDLNYEVAEELLAMKGIFCERAEDGSVCVEKFADAKSIPIIAMTANAFSEDVKKSMDAGMNEHLAKPMNLEKLLATLYRCCKTNFPKSVKMSGESSSDKT